MLTQDLQEIDLLAKPGLPSHVLWTLPIRRATTCRLSDTPLRKTDVAVDACKARRLRLEFNKYCNEEVQMLCQNTISLHIHKNRHHNATQSHKTMNNDPRI